jgi:hypothetical protein
VYDFTGWADDFRVQVGGRGVVSHAGAVALRVLEDMVFATKGQRGRQLLAGWQARAK